MDINLFTFFSKAPVRGNKQIRNGQSGTTWYALKITPVLSTIVDSDSGCLDRKGQWEWSQMICGLAYYVLTSVVNYTGPSPFVDLIYIYIYCRNRPKRVFLKVLAWPVVYKWYAVVVRCWTLRSKHDPSKSLSTNCGLLLVNESYRMPYRIIESWSSIVETDDVDVFALSIARFYFAQRSVMLTSYWFQFPVFGKEQRMSTSTNSSGPIGGSPVRSRRCFIVAPFWAHLWQSCTVL